MTDLNEYENNPEYEKRVEGEVTYYEKKDVYIDVNKSPAETNRRGETIREPIPYVQHQVRVEEDKVSEIRKQKIPYSHGKWEKLNTTETKSYTIDRPEDYEQEITHFREGEEGKIVKESSYVRGGGVERSGEYLKPYREQQEVKEKIMKNKQEALQKYFKDNKMKDIEEKKSAYAVLRNTGSVKEAKAEALRQRAFRKGVFTISETTIKKEELPSDFVAYDSNALYHPIEDVKITEVVNKPPKLTASFTNPDLNKEPTLLMNADKWLMESQRAVGEFKKDQKPLDMGKAMFEAGRGRTQQIIVGAGNVVEYAKEHKAETAFTVGLVLLPETASTVSGLFRAGKAGRTLSTFSKVSRVATNIYFGSQAVRYGAEFNKNILTTTNKGELLSSSAGELAFTVGSFKFIESVPRVSVKVAKAGKKQYLTAKHNYKVRKLEKTRLDTDYKFSKDYLEITKDGVIEKNMGFEILDKEGVIDYKEIQTQLYLKNVDILEGATSRYQAKLEPSSTTKDFIPSKQTRLVEPSKNVATSRPDLYYPVEQPVSNWDFSLKYIDKKPRALTRKIYGVEDNIKQTFLKESDFNKFEIVEQQKPKPKQDVFIIVEDKNIGLLEVRDLRGEVIFSVKKKVGPNKPLYSFAEPISAVASELGQYEMVFNKERTPFLDEAGRVLPPEHSTRFGLKEAKPKIDRYPKPKLEIEGATGIKAKGFKNETPFDIAQNNEIILASVPFSHAEPMVKTETKLLTRPTTKTTPSITHDNVFKQETATELKQVTKQKTEIFETKPKKGKEIFETEEKIIYIPKDPDPKFPPPSVFIPPLPKGGGGKPLTRGGTFKTFVKRRGVFSVVGESSSAEEAIIKGREIVSNTASASFKVEGGPNIFNTAEKLLPSSQFRRSKQDPNVFVEKRGKRIKSRGELEEITFAPRKKSFFGRKSKKKRFSLF